MLRNKKCQAAMEFLMTYGWAILIVIIAIAALVYFGVLSPERFISDQCTLEAPLSCSQQGDWIIQAQNSDNVIINIVNGAGKNLQQVTIDIYEADGQLCIPSQTNPTTIADGAKAQFAFTCNDISSITPLDTKFKGDLTVIYRVSAGQFVQESSGKIVGEVQRASSQSSGGGGQTQCNDNQDNDNDNFIDCQDSGCVNNGQCDPSDNNEFTPPECNDNQDNDGDNLIDCQDPGCEDPNDPNLCNSNDDSELNQGSAECSDGIDNDNDGTTDMNDPGCSSPNDTSEKGTIACDNSLDDDTDGRTDYNTNPNIGDPGCTGPSDTSEKGNIACDDGIDNDNDGTTDMNDPGCSSPNDTSEKGTTIQCDDNQDNDGDGKTDYNINAGISDPECTSPNDNNESG